MEKNKYSLLALTLAMTATIAFSSCSSSGVNESTDAPTEDLPVVDAETDQLPPTAAADGTVAPVDATSGAIDGAAVAQDPSAMPPADTAAPAPVADASTTMGSGAPPSMDAGGAVAGAAVPEPASTGTEPQATEYTGPLTGGAGGPDSEHMTAASTGSSNPTGSYTVQKGDTLMKVAYKVYGDIFRWKEILEANHDTISDVKKLKAGSTLKVDGDAQEISFEGYERYTIKTGDTLGTIAHDVYGTKKRWKKLWKMNEKLIKDPNRIYAGFYLRYKFSSEDQQKKDQLQQSEGAAPLADTSGGGAPAPAPEERNPSSVGGAAHPAANGGPTITSEPMNNPQGQ